MMMMMQGGSSGLHDGELGSKYGVEVQLHEPSGQRLFKAILAFVGIMRWKGLYLENLTTIYRVMTGYLVSGKSKPRYSPTGTL